MKLCWKSNSRIKRLADSKNIIAACPTSDFPEDTATVVMRGINGLKPNYTIHIRGKKQVMQWGSYTPVLRVNVCHSTSSNIPSVDFFGRIPLPYISEVENLIKEVEGVICSIW